jgi:glycogen debranching enzyme
MPEWSHTIQTAFDDCPSFVRWQRWAQGADITQAESPDLAAYLYREATTLARMADLAGRPEEAPELLRRAAMLQAAVERMWREDTASYHYVDRDHHESPPGQVLAQGRGEFSAEIGRRFSPSARLLIRCAGPRDAARPAATAILHGRGRRGRHRIETIKPAHFQWYWGLGTASSEKVYAEVERVEVHGLGDEFEITVATVDYTRQDQTLLLPLWAGLPDRQRAETLVRRTVLDEGRYWRPYGLPNCSAQDPAYRADNREGSGGVWLMWNTMIGEGLLEYGYREEAAELVRRLMTAMIHTLKTDQAFREAYNPDTLAGLGDRDYLWGVAPAHLFLQTAGIRIVSPRKVWIGGHNPFDRPVTVRARGVSVTRAGDTATVVFPSERQVTVTGVEPQFVEDPAGG